MNCRRCHALLPALLEGNLSSEQEREASAHLEACPECARELRIARNAKAALSELPTHAAPPNLRANIRSAIVEQRTTAKRPFFRVGAPFYAGGLALTTLCLLVLARPYFTEPTSLSESASQDMAREAAQLESGADSSATSPTDSSAANEAFPPAPRTNSQVNRTKPANSPPQSASSTPIPPPVSLPPPTTNRSAESAERNFAFSESEPAAARTGPDEFPAPSTPRAARPKAPATANSPRASQKSNNNSRPTQTPNAKPAPKIVPKLAPRSHSKSEAPIAREPSQKTEKTSPAPPAAPLRADKPLAAERALPSAPAPRVMLALRHAESTANGFATRDEAAPAQRRAANEPRAEEARESAVPDSPATMQDEMPNEATAKSGGGANFGARMRSIPAPSAPAASALSAASEPERAPLQLELRVPANLPNVRVLVGAPEGSALPVEIWRGSLSANLPVLVTLPIREQKSGDRVRVFVEQIQGDGESKNLQTEVLTVP